MVGAPIHRAYAVIPTRGDRMDTLAPMVRLLVSEDIGVFVIDNSDTGVVGDELRAQMEAWAAPTNRGWTIIRWPEQPPNLSRLWNIGLNHVDRHNQHAESTTLGAGAYRDYAVAVLNDDLILPPRFMYAMSVAIEETGAAVAYPDQFGALGPGQIRHVHLQPGPVDLRTRMCGYAFVLRGSAGLRADENLQWWYGDDDLDWRARQNGGSCLVGGIQVQHMHPNESTNANPELGAQAGRDRQTFIDKWGRAPW